MKGPVNRGGGVPILNGMAHYWFQVLGSTVIGQLVT